MHGCRQFHENETEAFIIAPENVILNMKHYMGSFSAFALHSLLNLGVIFEQSASLDNCSEAAVGQAVYTRLSSSGVDTYLMRSLL